MRRERIPIKLFIEDGISKANIKSNHKVTDTKNIIDILEKLSKSNKIVKAKKIKKENFIDFVYDINDEENYSIVVRIDNKEKDNHYEIMKYLEALCNLSISLKKVNRTRFVAGLAIGTLVLISMGPTIAKIAKNNDEAYNKYQQEQYEEFLENMGNNEHYYPTEEEKQEADQDYYERLKKRAENGDEKAKAEYEDYYYEQLMLEQMKSEPSENDYKIRY